MEHWLEIEDFPNYEVSSHGRVRNKRTERILKPMDNRRGALMVFLHRDGQGYSKALRRLVAEAFEPMGDRDDLTPIHLDCDYTNCAIDNLEWKPRWMAQAWTKQNKRGPASSRTIVDLTTGETWENALAAAKELHTTEYLVLQTALSTTWRGEPNGRYKGHEFRFEDHIS